MSAASLQIGIYAWVSSAIAPGNKSWLFGSSQPLHAQQQALLTAWRRAQEPCEFTLHALQSEHSKHAAYRSPFERVQGVPFRPGLLPDQSFATFQARTVSGDPTERPINAWRASLPGTLAAYL